MQDEECKGCRTARPPSAGPHTTSRRRGTRTPLGNRKSCKSFNVANTKWKETSAPLSYDPRSPPICTKVAAEMIRADMACLAPFLQLPCFLQKDNMVYPPQKSVHILKRFLTKKTPLFVPDHDPGIAVSETNRGRLRQVLAAIHAAQRNLPRERACGTLVSPDYAP